MSPFTNVDNMCLDLQTVYFIETERDQNDVAITNIWANEVEFTKIEGCLYTLLHCD